MSSNSIKCPQCGFVGWSSEQTCRQCGCDLTYSYQNIGNDYKIEEPPKTKSFIIWLIVIGVFVFAAAFAFIPTKPKEKVNPNSTAKELKKPINTPGEQIDYKEYMVEGKTNIVYFYADW